MRAMLKSGLIADYRICGRSFKTNRNLKIHFSHKHKQQTPAQYHSSGFWPCGADTRCACCKTDGHFTQTVTSTTTGEKIYIYLLYGKQFFSLSRVFWLVSLRSGFYSTDHYHGNGPFWIFFFRANATANFKLWKRKKIKKRKGLELVQNKWTR